MSEDGGTLAEYEASPATEMAHHVKYENAKSLKSYNFGREFGMRLAYDGVQRDKEKVKALAKTLRLTQAYDKIPCMVGLLFGYVWMAKRKGSMMDDVEITINDMMDLGVQVSYYQKK